MATDPLAESLAESFAAGVPTESLAVEALRVFSQQWNRYRGWVDGRGGVVREEAQGRLSLNLVARFARLRAARDPRAYLRRMVRNAILDAMSEELEWQNRVMLMEHSLLEVMSDVRQSRGDLD